jgi:hypothetical protein
MKTSEALMVTDDRSLVKQKMECVGYTGPSVLLRVLPINRYNGVDITPQIHGHCRVTQAGQALQTMPQFMEI